MQRQTATNCGVRMACSPRTDMGNALLSIIGSGSSRGKTLAFSFYPPPAASYRTWTAHSEEVQRKLVEISVAFTPPSLNKIKEQWLRYQIMLNKREILSVACGI